MATEETYTTGKVARMAEVSQQTVIRWAREGLLKPSKRHTPTANRRYTLNDVVAGQIAATSLEIGIKRKVVKEIVKTIQRANKDELEHALIFTRKVADAKKDQPGLMQHFFCPNDKEPDQEKYLDWCRKEDLIVTEATLLQLVEGVLKVVRKRLDSGIEGALGDLTERSD